MDFQRIFGTAFRYPLNLKLFAIIFVFSLFMTVPPIIYAPSGRMETVQELVGFFNFMVPLWLASFFVGNFLAAFFYDSASRYYPKTQYGKLGDSLSAAKKRYLALLGTQILLFFLVAIVFAAFFAGPLILVLAGIPIEYLLIAGIMLGVTSLALMMFFLFLGPFACVVDGLGPFESLKKSYKLVRENRLKAFVFWLILLVVVFIIGLLGSLPSSVYTATGGELLSETGMALLLVQVLFSSYTVLFSYSANVNFYTALKGEAKISSAVKPAPVTKPSAAKSASAKPKPKTKARPKAKPKKKPARKRKK